MSKKMKDRVLANLADTKARGGEKMSAFRGIGRSNLYGARY